MGIRCVAVCVGLLALADAASAADPPGEQARKSCTEKARDQAKQAFKDGIVAFERKDWLRAEYHMLTALESGCDREDLTVTVPYGRWRYRYQPQIYLGLALHRLGQCLKVNGEVCAITRRDWTGNWDEFLQKRLGEPGADWSKARVVDAELQNRCQQARAKVQPPTCCVDEGCFVKLRRSNAEYSPSIDWWHKLGSANVEAAIQETTEEQCQEVTTPVEWLWPGKPGRGSNARLCEQLGQELSRLENACRR
jgi:hypothetical protein